MRRKFSLCNTINMFYAIKPIVVLFDKVHQVPLEQKNRPKLINKEELKYL